MSAFEDYTSALSKYRKLKSDAEEIAKNIRDVGDQLSRNTLNFSFTNNSVKVPFEVSGMRDSRLLDANDWKSADQINDLISRLHEMASLVKQCWKALPEEQKSEILHPPEELGIRPRRR